MHNKLSKRKSREIVDIPEMAEYVIPSSVAVASSIPSLNTSTPENLTTHQTPCWDDVSGITKYNQFISPE